MLSEQPQESSLRSFECRACRVTKPVSEFYRNARNRSGHSYECKECRKDYSRQYGTSEKGQAVRKARQALYYQENRETHRLRTYGITPEEYQRMLEEQNGLCAICHQPERMKLRGRVKQLCVDHDHATGKVRRLLCHPCNAKLGWVENNLPAILAYLNVSPPTD